MLTNIRYKLALRLIRKADELIKKGGYENIKTGLRYFKWSILVVPPSNELREAAKRLREIAEDERAKLQRE